MTERKKRIRLRTDTAANWVDANTVLGYGEVGIEIDTRRFKFGNGVTEWILLGYATVPGGAGGSSEWGGITGDISTQIDLQAALDALAGQTDGLAAVASSGDYGDLDNLPTLGNAASADVSDFATSSQGDLADTAIQPDDLGTAAALDVGTIPGSVAAGDDSRLSDSRSPISHASSHAIGGSDPIFSTNIHNAGTSIAPYELLYFGSDGKWRLADADTAATSIGRLAIALESGTDSNPINVAMKGAIVSNESWSWTIGARLFMSTVAGEITETPPSATDNVIRVIGMASSATSIVFDPSPDYVEHT